MQNSKNSAARLDILAAISGVLIAFQSKANGELSRQLDNGELSRQLDSGAQAALISFSSGLIVVAIVTVFNPKIRLGLKRLKTAYVNREIPRWRLFAGMLGGSFVAVQSHVVPIIGVALFSVASIAGQTATSLIVDRIGLTGGGPKPISPRRITAALITVFAVLVSVLDKLESVNFSILSVLLALFGGAFVGIQRALNGQINEFTKQSYATSLLNFVMGTILLIFLIAFSQIFVPKDNRASASMDTREAKAKVGQVQLDTAPADRRTCRSRRRLGADTISRGWYRARRRTGSPC